MSGHVEMEYTPLERAASWQDVRDAPSLASRHSSIVDEDEYRYVEWSKNRQYRKPPAHFSLTILRIDGEVNKKTCHPGSIFEGTIQIKLDFALAAQNLKLIFKAAERIHVENTIGKSTKKKGERLFAIRSILWGLNNNQETERWPVMEAGDHEIPFMCEIPMVNYPPTFRHHLASCEFELIACLDRPGIRPFQSIPIFIRYEPIVISSSIKSIETYQDHHRISNNIKMTVKLLNGNNLNITADHTLNLQLSIVSLVKGYQIPTDIISNVEVFLKRQLTILHGSYHRSDTMVMSHVDQSCFGTKQETNGQKTYFVRLPIPTESSMESHPTVLKNFEVLGMTPTLNFSRHIKMEYKLYVTGKIKKNGLISTKKQLFCIPMQFGTISPGERLPSTLLSYRDPQVISDTTLSTKPKFIKVRRRQEQLPAYNEDLSPPKYDSAMRMIRPYHHHYT